MCLFISIEWSNLLKVKKNNQKWSAKSFNSYRKNDIFSPMAFHRVRIEVWTFCGPVEIKIMNQFETVVGERICSVVVEFPDNMVIFSKIFLCMF